MVMTLEIMADRRNPQWTADRLDEALRDHWTRSKSIAAIARSIDVDPALIRARAMRIGLAQRPRASLTD